MYLTVDETAAVLGVSARWVRERIDAGDSVISRHLKCRRETAPRQGPDRSPVRIASADLAHYIVSNTREHGWSPFPGPSTDSTAVESVEHRIWSYLSWFRRQSSPKVQRQPLEGPKPKRAVG